MREIKGVVYPDCEDEAVRVAGVKALPDRMMLIDFANGERRLFDSTLLKGPAFEKLDDAAIFAAPTIEHGVVAWDDGNIDVAPEFMYANSYAYNERDVLTA